MHNQILAARVQAQTEAAQAWAQVQNTTQNQNQNQSTTVPTSTTTIYGVNAIPVTSVAIPVSRPWGMLDNFIPEGYH